MKHFVRVVVTAIAAMVAAPVPAQIDAKDFKTVEIFKEKTLKTEWYSFDVEAPPRYPDMGWLRSRGKREKRNLVMRTGSDGMDSYAISVLRTGAASRGQDAATLAKAQHPNATFVPVAGNAHCVSMPLDAPLQLNSGMLAFLAYCVHPETGEGYELAVSYRSIDAYFFNRKKAPGSKECAGVSPIPAECGDPYDAMRGVMRSLTGTFTFKGVDRR